MVWRATGAETRRTKGSERKAAMEARVRGGVPIGILGYLGNEPVAWCSIAPRPTYRPLGGPDVAAGQALARAARAAHFKTDREDR
jgi:hypothetical protein